MRQTARLNIDTDYLHAATVPLYSKENDRMWNDINDAMNNNAGCMKVAKITKSVAQCPWITNHTGFRGGPGVQYNQISSRGGPVVAYNQICSRGGPVVAQPDRIKKRTSDGV